MASHILRTRHLQSSELTVMKVLHAAILTGVSSGITMSIPIILSQYFGVGFGLFSWLGGVSLANMGLALLIGRCAVFRGRRDVGLFGAFSAVAVTVVFMMVMSIAWLATGNPISSSDYGSLALAAVLYAILLGGLPGLVGAVLSRRVTMPFPTVLRRRDAWKPSRVNETIPSFVFEVSVSVPSAAKTVTLEVAADHTVGSLVETVTSALNLPKGRAYAVEYGGKLISRGDFGKLLSTFGIKESSKLSLRIVE